MLGCDPGIRGGLAIIEVVDAVAPKLVDTIDIPVTGVGAKERVDVLAVRDWIAKHRPQHAYIERAQAMPRQGSSSGFKYGRSVGHLEAAVVCCLVPMTIVEPAMWKRHYRLRGDDKESSRQRALQLFPSAHAKFVRKKDHGKAEAALIALYGAAFFRD